MLKYVLSFVLFCIPFISYGEDFVAGKDYEVLKTVLTQESHDRVIKVTEFFSYGCPWCFKIEPTLNSWVAKQGAKIFFHKIPVVFQPDWEFYAKAYYTANALSLNKTLDPLFFKAILQDKLPLKSNQAMVDFFVKQGVERQTVESAFQHSPSIDMELKHGMAKMARYHINAVPAFVVNRQFKTDLQMAKTEERLFAILDYLVAQSK